MQENFIRTLIPHREPFVFLRSVELRTGNSGRGVARWPASHPILAGHFPGLPIVPGVCQIEAAAQLAAAIASSAGEGQDDGKLGVLGDIRKAFLHAPLFGDQDLELEAELRGSIGPMGLCSGRGRRGQTQIITFELMLALVPASELEAEIMRHRESET